MLWTRDVGIILETNVPGWPQRIWRWLKCECYENPPTHVQGTLLMAVIKKEFSKIMKFPSFLWLLGSAFPIWLLKNPISISCACVFFHLASDVWGQQYQLANIHHIFLYTARHNECVFLALRTLWILC